MAYDMLSKTYLDDENYDTLKLKKLEKHKK